MKSLETALPEDESSFKGTAISSDDGAKILKDIDSAIAKYENSNDRASRLKQRLRLKRTLARRCARRVS